MTEAATTDLAERVAQLEDRIDTLESRLSDSGIDHAELDDGLDRYDAAVIDALEPGTAVSLDGLRDHYRRAGVKKETTLKRRIRDLTGMPYFERVPGRKWMFAGVKRGEKE